MKGAKPMRPGTAEAVALSLLFLTSASCAGWREDAAPRDVERLSHLTEARQKGLDEAASAPDIAAIRSILQAGTVAASADRLAGTWRCRTMKLGGLTPAIVYSWFRCRISEHGGRLTFEKLGGSQRTSGTLYPEGDGFVYLGASYVHYNGANEKPRVYSGSGAAAGAAATPDDQIGLLSLTYDGRARLELPYPVQESTYDVIELKR
jgi:hypothetical protein